MELSTGIIYRSVVDLFLSNACVSKVFITIFVHLKDIVIGTKNLFCLISKERLNCLPICI